MPKTISAPVGEMSPNRPADVEIIQSLLNRVPLNQGGLPAIQKLAVDRIFGPKTQKAIYDFQRKHFGQRGADGRIEPGKQTLAKLNSFETPAAALPPPKPKVTSRQFMLQFVNKGNIIGVYEKDRFILVTLIPTQQQAIYWLGQGQSPLPIPNKFEGVFSILKTTAARAVDELAGTGIYKSDSDGKSVVSVMMMRISDESVRIQMNAHFVEAGSNSHTMFAADFSLVKSDVAIF